MVITCFEQRWYPRNLSEAVFYSSNQVRFHRGYTNTNLLYIYLSSIIYVIRDKVNGSSGSPGLYSKLFHTSET